MKKTVLTYSLLISIFASITTQAAWLNSYNDAIRTAQRKNLPILADVSGKNWCIWCKRLDKEVFDTAAFKSFANKNLVLLLIDVPNPRSPSPEAKLFMKKFPIRGYPTVFLLDKNGKVLHKTGYLKGGPANYIKALKPFIKTTSAVPKKAALPQPKSIINEQETQNRNHSISKNKIIKLNDIITNYSDSGQDLESSSVQEEILTEVNNNLSYDRHFKVSNISEFDIAQLAAKQTNKIYPENLNNLKQKYYRQAEKKYHTASINDNVTVNFKKGNSVYTASGIFYGYTMAGNGIVVGKYTIPVFDLMPKSKYLFSKELCEKSRSRYIKNKINLYIQKKNSYKDSQVPIAKKMLIEANVNAGYIFYNNKWQSVNDIVLSLLKTQIEEQKINNVPAAKEINTKDINSKLQFLTNFKPDINPYIFIPLILIMSIIGISSFICLIISFVRMFQNGKTAIGLLCIILSIFSGIGPIIAFIYCWVKVSEFGINKLMKFWTFCILINIILSIVIIWQCFSALLPLIT